MHSFEKTAENLVAPLGFFYICIWLISGIWLAVVDNWGLIAYGVTVSFISIFGLVSALMPGMLFAGPAAAFKKNNKKMGFYILSCLTTFYSMTVMSIWCITIMHFFLKESGAGSFVPTLLWSYCVAIGPILWISNKDIQSKERYAINATVFAQLACLSLVFVNILITLPLAWNIALFTMVMLAGFTVQVKMASRDLDLIFPVKEKS